MARDTSTFIVTVQGDVVAQCREKPVRIREEMLKESALNADPLENSCPLEISCHEVQAKLAAGEPFILLDCRESEEHAIVSLPDSELFPLSLLSSRAGKLDHWKDGPIVVFCHHGMRSAQLTVWLREQGFPNVQSMAGGIDAWAQQIDPSLRRY